MIQKKKQTKSLFHNKKLNTLRRDFPYNDKRASQIIYINVEGLKAFHIKSGAKPPGLLLPLLFNTVLEGLARTIRQEGN